MRRREPSNALYRRALVSSAARADGHALSAGQSSRSSPHRYPPGLGTVVEGDDTHPFNLDIPEDTITNPRTQYYGYSVTDEWIGDYVRRCTRVRLTQAEATNLHPARAMILALQRETGIKTLMFRTACPDDTSPGVYTWDNPPRVPIVSLCSNEDTVFQYRPSLKQLQRMTTMMGSSPRWWLDSWWYDAV